MIIRVLQILAAIAVAVICYMVIPWVLGLLGISIPERLLMAIMVFIVLVAIIGALQGRYDSWWGPKA